MPRGNATGGKAAYSSRHSERRGRDSAPWDSAPSKRVISEPKEVGLWSGRSLHTLPRRFLPWSCFLVAAQTQAQPPTNHWWETHRETTSMGNPRSRPQRGSPPNGSPRQVSPEGQYRTNVWSGVFLQRGRVAASAVHEVADSFSRSSVRIWILGVRGDAILPSLACDNRLRWRNEKPYNEE